MKLKMTPSDAEKALEAVPHKRLQDARDRHWRVTDGEVDGRDVCWLYCWAKTGMGSLAAAEAAQVAFDEVLDVPYSLFDARVDHEWAREKRYSVQPIDRELENLLRR
jgi:hypothetical protein